jgi:hypothetical protein
MAKEPAETTTPAPNVGDFDALIAAREKRLPTIRLLGKAIQPKIIPWQLALRATGAGAMTPDERADLYREVVDTGLGQGTYAELDAAGALDVDTLLVLVTLIQTNYSASNWETQANQFLGNPPPSPTETAPG